MTGMYVASNPTALSAQFGLTRNMGALGDVLTRLSTGLKINSGKDDPAGLIASELLKAQITGTSKAITNTQRANSLIATADSSMNQIGTLLNDIKGLVVEAANTGTMTADQIAANQLQVDAALDSIDRIARTTNYGGKKLLDGSLGFQTAGMSGGLSNVQINSANFGTASAIGVNVNVQKTADYARLVSNGTGVSTDTMFDITGNRGTATVSVGAGSSNADIAAAINQATDSTGVVAYVEGQAERGSLILSSAGAGNEIVVTALDKGLDAGNYEFRITKGTTNDARIVTEAKGGKPGIVEISLTAAYEARYNDFAGLFDITVDTTNRTNPTTDPTSVNMTRGTSNKVVYHDTASNASTNVVNGKSVIATAVTDAHQSDLNGWTIAVNNTIATAGGSELTDLDTKTVYVNTASTIAQVQTALGNALGDTVPGALTTPTVTLSNIGFAFGTDAVNGDRFTFANGADAGEVTITYKEGATADDILKLLNSATNVSATLKNGVKGSDLIPNLPAGQTYMGRTAGPNVESRYSSGATSQQVIDLINSKLGDKFMATSLGSGGTGGRVSFMDAAVDYGDINLGNALRFTGMDNGPIVRLTNLGANGQPVANQALSLNIIHPSEADIKAGIHTPVLEIKLATDAQGNSITTAKDIVDLFNKLTPEKTLGVSASQLYPPGVDPNGRIFGEDACGKPFVLETCPNPINGIVQPTGAPGTCGPQQGDLVLLGGNQRLVADNAVARVASGTTVTGVAAITVAHPDAGTGGTVFATFGASPAAGNSDMNGVSIGFTRDETREGFDATNGVLRVYLGPDVISGTTTNDQMLTLLNSAIAANWESIRAFTGATGDAVKATSLTAGAAGLALTDAGIGDAAGAGVFEGTSTISKTDAAGTPVGTRGVAIEDPALIIKALEKGTNMAGINFHFINDTESGLTAYTSAGGGAATGTPEIKVDFLTSEDGSRELIVTANITGGTTMNAIDLANALNANDTFKSMFSASASLAGANAAIGGVLFNTDVSKPAATTVGGYKIESTPLGLTNKVATSSGIGMTGQSDANERLIIESEELGSEQFVSLNVVKGTLNTVDEYGGTSRYANGSDMVATVNGIRATTKGNNVSINTTGLSLSMNVANGTGSYGFDITGGGALFQLGPDVVSQQQVRVGIGSMLTTQLGGGSGQLYQLRSGESAALGSSDAGRKLADRIVNEAISNVANIRGRLGAVQKGTLEPNVLALQDSMVALTEANAMITNADFAVESSNLTRLQLLIQAGAQTLGIANQLPQYAASLIR